VELGKGLEPDETGSSGEEQGQLACCCQGVGGMFGRRVGSGEVGSSERHHRTVARTREWLASTAMAGWPT